MSRVLDRISGVIARRPRIALGILIVAVVVLSAGNGLRVEQAGNEVFLPDGSDVAAASNELSERFPDSAGLVNVTVIHRGDVLTPDGLAQVDAVVDAAVADPEVAPRLALTNPVASIAAIYSRALQTKDLSTVPQMQLAAVTDRLRSAPETAAPVGRLLGAAAGEDLAISSIRLRDLGDGDDARSDAELRIAEVVADVAGPLDVRSLSQATIDAESADATGSTMTVLMLIALAVIAALLFVFFRTGSDVVLGFLGLAFTVAGTLGFQGWAGPDGLGIIGAPNSITSMVPIMMIGLVVDYAIQSVAHYREERLAGHDVATSARLGLGRVALPLGLAAGTTIISFLTNLVSPIPANADFGSTAAFGVAFGLTTMLVLVPAARTVLDQRRERAETLSAPRPMSDAIPGAGPVIERVGAVVARSPMIVLAGVLVVTVGLGAAATRINTEFNSNAFLPSGGASLTDIEALEEALGGQTEVVTALIEAELTDDRTLRNLLTLTDAFADDLSRPTGAASDITLSLGTLIEDWETATGEPDDNFDPELLELAQAADQGLTLDPVVLQEFFDQLEADDPIGFAQVAVNDPDGVDSMLVQFNALTGDQVRTGEMVDDLEGLWFGDPDQITATSGEIVALEVVGAMTDAQTGSIVLTLIAALIVLMLFIWATEFKPMLAVLAVVPIGMVLLWVLGTMTIVGIPYNLITALITALSIGIGVDYTIHVIHRFTEELEHGRTLIGATTETLRTTGSALVGSALTTALGFGVLVLSPLLPMRQFGIVTAITILYALIAAIVVVPPLMIVWAAYHQWRATMTGQHESPAAPAVVAEPASTGGDVEPVPAPTG